ncbi:hypothetical protein BH11PSE8_BH11PSE8_34280 [soil metagenome]
MRLTTASPGCLLSQGLAPAMGAKRALVAVNTLFCSMALVACAQAATAVTGTSASAATAASPVAGPLEGLRVQVRTVADWPSLPALAARLAAISGVPVREIAGMAPQRVSVTLDCADAPACDRALARLDAERAVVAEVTPDERRKLPTRPPRRESK